MNRVVFPFENDMRCWVVVWLLMWLTTVSYGTAADIGFVTTDGQLDKEFDQFWVNRLEDQGHHVSVLPQTYGSNDADVANVDLFIVSNDIVSTEFIAGDAGAARTLNLNAVDLSSHTNPQLTLSLAARPTGWDEGIDFVKLRLDTTGDGVYDTLLADFQPIGGDLEDTLSGMLLTDAFDDFTISIPNGVQTLRLQVEAYSTATGEQFGLDNIRVTAAGGVIISTEDFEGGPNQIGYRAQGQGGANASFWDLSTAPNVFPEVEFFDYEGDTWFGGADLDAAFGDILSSRVSDPRPLITYEDALFDDLGIGAAGGRTDGDTIDIEDASHPLAAGLSDDVQIFEFAQGITQLGGAAPGTEVIASYAGAPAIAVLEAGRENLMGLPSPRRVIAFFPQDISFGDDYTDAGLALLDASVAYAVSGAVAPGDFDGDGMLTVADINRLTSEIKAGDKGPEFDLNGDGEVDAADHAFWVTDVKFTWFGDANLDGEFNSADFVAVFTAGEYEDAEPMNSGWQEGDWNADGDFTSTDFVAAFTDGGYELGPRTAVRGVPEPQALVILVVGLTACWLTSIDGLRRRRRRR